MNAILVISKWGNQHNEPVDRLLSESENNILLRQKISEVHLKLVCVLFYLCIDLLFVSEMLQSNC